MACHSIDDITIVRRHGCERYENDEKIRCCGGMPRRPRRVERRAGRRGQSAKAPGQGEEEELSRELFDEAIKKTFVANLELQYILMTFVSLRIRALGQGRIGGL